MATRQERLAARRARIERQANTIVEQAVERVVAARPRRATPAPPTPAPPQGEATPEAVRAMRDQGASWMAIGKHFGLPGAKYGAGRARALYAASNGGVVPRAYKPRTGTTPKAQTPGSTGTITSRKQQLVDHGHVIPRDYTDEEVEALVVGRTIEWAIDMARLTNTDPDTWGEGRWVTNDARVHVDPKWVRVVDREDEGKDRVLYFREYAGRDKEGNNMSGPTRVVRVDAIFTIR